ncbi:MAG: biotin transporter BioY [Calditrichales bacterium]|nr:MAG: biotin transporter BioY [Calditrichales bacterium]
MRNSTYANLFRPEIRKEAYLYDLMLVIGGSVFIALCAQFSFSVPFSPVPITGQTFAIILTGAFLGSRMASLTVIAYLLEGIAGLPVFAHAQFGLAHLFGPTGGYLIGFVPAAFVTGWLAEQGWGKSIFATFVMMGLGTALVFVCGLSWLSLFFGSNNVIEIGLFPYLPGAFVKIVLATLIFTGSRAIIAFRNKGD